LYNIFENQMSGQTGEVN